MFTITSACIALGVKMNFRIGKLWSSSRIFYLFATTSIFFDTQTILQNYVKKRSVPHYIVENIEEAISKWCAVKNKTYGEAEETYDVPISVICGRKKAE